MPTDVAPYHPQADTSCRNLCASPGSGTEELQLGGYEGPQELLRLVRITTAACASATALVMEVPTRYLVTPSLPSSGFFGRCASLVGVTTGLRSLAAHLSVVMLDSQQDCCCLRNL